MPTTIKLKNSVTTTNAPSSLAQGEVAINITDKKVWVGNAATTPIQLLGDGGSASFTSIAFGAGTVSSPSITFTGDTNTGIYSPAADTIAFTEGGVESMRIDSSGNVLIGTTSAATSSTLNVVGTGYQPVFVNTTNAGGGGVSFQRSGTLALYTGTAGSSWLTGSSTADGLIRSEANMLFAVGNTERMRITSAGSLLVGNTTTINGGKLYSESSTTPAEFYSTGAAGNAGMFVEKSVNDSTTSNVFVRFFINNGSAGSGQINANGASSAAFGTYSDERLKQNIEDLPSQLENIKSLRPVEFDYKAGGHQIGFIAQEMQEIYPDTVGASEDGMLTITGWDKTTARLVKAIQEQQAMIEELKQEVTKLKGV